MKKPPPIVCVMWEDAAQKETGTWIDHPDKHEYEPNIMLSVGFLLSDTKDGVILTPAWGQDQIAPRDQIPRGMIRKIAKLKA